MVTCPNCDTDIDVEEDELDEGDVLTCDECGSTLNVLGLSPLELEVEDEETAGDDEDDDDEDEDEEYLEDDEEDADEEDEEDDDEDW